MTDVQIAEELLPVTANLVGGRDITSSYIADEVSPNTHPLSKNSKIVIAPGYLTQFAFPCAGRLSVGAKSPLTHGIKESNVGGTMSKALSDNGISAVIIEGIIERAAKLVAANLGAVILKTEKARSAEKPVLMTIEGTTFYKLKNFQKMFDSFLQEFLSGDKKRYYEITEVQNSSLLGAAIAAIVN